MTSDTAAVKIEEKAFVAERGADVTHKRELAVIRVLFLIYCLLTVWIILFKMADSPADLPALVKPRSINWIPFYYQELSGTRFHRTEVLSNLAVFIPFGLYAKMLGAGNRRTVLYGLAFSFTLELCQFVFRLGASDVTDLITNTLGALAGVCLYAVLLRLVPTREKANRLLTVLALTATLLLFALLAVLIVMN